MSDKSDKDKKDAKPAKGKRMLVTMIGGIVLLGLGGGAVFGLVQAGVIGSSSEAKEDNTPKLIRKGEEDPYAPKTEGEGEGSGGEPVYGDGGSEYRTIYYTFDGDFTSNLKDSDALIQVSLAASTRRDGRVLMWLKEHELAIRSHLLTILADTPENDVYTVAGKERLQKRLTAEINKVLIAHEGFGGIDSVYFRSFIIQ